MYKTRQTVGEEKKSVRVKVGRSREIKVAMETFGENDRQRDSEEERKKGGQRELAFHY